MDILYVAFGGACGAALRYGLKVGFSDSWLPHLGTTAANLLGCFFAGVILYFASSIGREHSLLITIGFLGSLTTMSSFITEVISLAQSGAYIAAILHWTVGSVMTLVIAITGFGMAKGLFG